ncbi:hypothetical protein [Virgibacillus chiguensis]|uniref:Uncharacterized protein n=1 Tax=Virgibacillus chiguensis TaxID=411959 RepID=A0A1M5MH13_9BACI|nr:hypothetical protein [Virgibacillus chiguensis]SHG76209.1 hypothetical protein SAMN05421807_101487 [Virgibacillus chiguensis]
MTSYYYIASDIELPSGIYTENGFEENKGIGVVSIDNSLDLTRSKQAVQGLKYPIQLEIVNGLCDPVTLEPDTYYELTLLYKYIYEVTREHKLCTIEIAHIWNEHRRDFKIKKKKKILLKQLKSPKELLLHEGEALIIKKTTNW